LRFKGDGICSGIPAIGKSTKPIPRAKVDTYSVREKHGLILAFLGDLLDGIHAYREASLRKW
jgi:phenylpropionate dioxygenase-like ring-hydroxylating dioxygenase large terminal subunit